MAISSKYVVSKAGPNRSGTLSFTQKRTAIRHARRIARLTVGVLMEVRTADGELIYQCRAKRGREAIHTGGGRVRIIAEEL